MYNSVQIGNFIEKVTEEAQKAAQEIFDKYTPELITRIQNQLQEKDILYIAMGTASLDKVDIYADKGEKFCQLIGETQYPVLEANFSLPYKIFKHSVSNE